MMNAPHIVFSKRAYNSIIAETYDKSPLETGGILIGTVLDSGVWLVLENIPPGENSTHQYSFFQYDEKFVSYLANVVSKEYSIALHVLGLWHRHPGSMDVFSSTDDVTNIQFAEASKVGCISCLINMDPDMRLTVYHVNSSGSYTKLDWSLDDGIVPEHYYQLKYGDFPLHKSKNVHPLGDLMSVGGGSCASQAADRGIDAQGAHGELDDQKISVEEIPLSVYAERVPTVYLSDDLFVHYHLGVLSGYFVENTAIYNILPAHSNLPDNSSSCSPQLFIFPCNPLELIQSPYDCKIKAIRSSPNSPEIALSLLKNSRSNFQKRDEKKASSVADLSQVIHQYQDALLEGLQCAIDERDGWTISLENGAASYLQCALSYLHRIFLPLAYLDPCLPEYRATEPLLMGYWVRDELHVVDLKSKQECQIEIYGLKQDIFSRNTGIIESDIMSEKKAMMIGCGSVGSLCALELARSGVSNFMLIDNDVFAYHNICRHQCGIFDVGRYKTEALSDRILQINPFANIVTHSRVVQEVPLDELYSFCDANTIAIGGADNRQGDLYANDIAQKTGMIFMSIGCWERAYAGEIFYCLSEGMPNYRDFMTVAGVMSTRVNNNRKFYTNEQDLAKLSFEPGISADINFVTTIAVKMALDLLNRDNPAYTPRLIPHLTQYTLICNTNDVRIGGLNAEIFSYPLQVTTSIVVPYATQHDD